MAAANVFSVPKCPRCRKLMLPAMTTKSLHDQETEICTTCGTTEWLEATGYVKPYTGPRYWEIARCDRTLDWIGG